MATHEGALTTEIERQFKEELLQSKKKSFKHISELDIPGVTKIVLSPSVQKSVGCVVGENVTEEKPWTYVKKELVENELGKSEFTSLKQDILEFPKEDFLFGYIPTDCDGNEFYICHTEYAQETVSELLKNTQQKQENEILSIINKSPRQWKSLGSEIEVEDLLVKSNRPLFKMEIVTEYPIMEDSVKFSYRKVEQAKDGYKEITFASKLPEVVYKRRIDAAIQASSPGFPREAQTICTYPQNAWAQYEYGPKIEDDQFLEEDQRRLNNFLSSISDDVVDKFDVNEHINFYMNDYDEIVNDMISTFPRIKPKYEELACYFNVDICKSKMIATAAWIADSLAIGYSNTSTTIFLDDQLEMRPSVYDSNPILLWKDDELNPALFLETNREITCLSFCPHNEDIIIGGCSNGQVLMWDVTVDLKETKVSDKMLLLGQLNNTTLKNSFANWSNNAHKLQSLRPAANSDLKCSHGDVVNAIEWISTNINVSKTGQLSKSLNKRIIQFATIGSDSCMLFWNIKEKEMIPDVFCEDMTTYSRLKNYPQALRSRPSRYSDVLERIYKVDLGDIIPMSFVLLFEEQRTQKDADLLEEIYIKATFCMGTAHGEWLIGTWKGSNPDIDDFGYKEEEEEENVAFSEEGAILNTSKYHDGPVVTISHSVALNAFLTVGGCVFAIWKLNLKEKPVFWRRSQVNYTYGAWNTNVCTIFELTRMDGILEIWQLLNRSDEFVDAQKISGNSLTGYHVQKENIGIADSNGFFRVLNLTQGKRSDSGLNDLEEFLENESVKKAHYMSWQKGWSEKYLVKPIETVDTKKPRKIIKKSSEVIKQKVQFSPEEKETNRLVEVLLAKKRLDKKSALEEQLPLVKMKEEKERKQLKLINRRKSAQKLFQTDIAVLFPEAVQEKPPSKINPYTIVHRTEQKLDCYDDYRKIADKAEIYIKSNPFSCTFDWNTVLERGRECRSYVDPKRADVLHKERLEEQKLARKRAAEEAEKAKILAKAAAELVKQSKRATRRFTRKSAQKDKSAKAVDQKND